MRNLQLSVSSQDSQQVYIRRFVPGDNGLEPVEPQGGEL